MKKSALVSKHTCHGVAALLIGSLGISGAHAVEGQRADLANREVLRVCADPAGIPNTNRKGEGFENKIANIIADELKIPVAYTWFPQAAGFDRNTLFAKRCDLVIGTGQGDPLVLNTNAYYRSAYALVYRANKGLDGVDSIMDPRLKGKRVGVFIGSPSASLVARARLMADAKSYRLMVDRRHDSPTEDMIKDIRSGEIDAGVDWGPTAGYFAKRGGEELVVVPLLKDGDTAKTTFRITMGVRQGEDQWKRQLNEVIRKRQADIDRVLLEYGVPLLDEEDHLITKPRG